MKEAFKLFQKAADLKNATGISNLGNCYKYGCRTGIDIKKALELYQKAAELENSFGINNLGNCYKDGFGTDIDKKKAFELFKKAANLGNSTAQYNLPYKKCISEYFCYISMIMLMTP
jgi:TPR repeat protein